jgi:hypothetical protein
LDVRFAYLRDRLFDLDRLLRGEMTRPEALSGKSLDVSARGLAIVGVVLAMFYGVHGLVLAVEGVAARAR